MRSLSCSTWRQDNKGEDYKHKPFQMSLHFIGVQNVSPLNPIKLQVACLQHQKITKPNQSIDIVWPNYAIMLNYSTFTLLNLRSQQCKNLYYSLKK